MKKQTKLLAILLTDLSGFTEFTANANRRGVMDAVLKQKSIIEPIAHDYGGRLVKWIGDAAMIVFETATDAVLCGRKIQEQFVTDGERGSARLPSVIKAVVHLGDVSVDTDGDIYGDAVNTVARIEKVAQPDEVYFSSTVRGAIPRSEVPSELVGEFEFKGLPEPTSIYKSCFGQTPIVQEQTILVQTNFAHTNQLADELGWDVVHPILDEITAAIIDAARRNTGINRGVMQTGCFLTFQSVENALTAATEWQAVVTDVNRRIFNGRFAVRTAIHRGTLHLMRYTMMGEDIDIIRTLSVTGHGHDVLITEPAAVSMNKEHHGYSINPVKPVELRECNSRMRWVNKYQSIPIYRTVISTL